MCLCSNIWQWANCKTYKVSNIEIFVVFDGCTIVGSGVQLEYWEPFRNFNTILPLLRRAFLTIIRNQTCKFIQINHYMQQIVFQL